MYKTAVIGDKQSIMGFSALGIDSFEVNEKSDAQKIISQLVKENYAVIYVTEKIFSQISDTVTRLRHETLPVLIPILGISGNTGVGLRQLYESVERAAGSNIL